MMMQSYQKWTSELIEPYLKGLTVKKLEKYLSKTGWKKNKVFEKLQVWNKSFGGFILTQVFPINDSFIDTRLRLMSSIESLSDIEERGFGEILKDITKIK